MEQFLNDKLVNLKSEVNDMLLNSSDEELKSFYSSTIGNFLLNVLEISHSSFNYTTAELINELNISTAKYEENIINLAKESSYHLKHRIPANLRYKIVIKNSNDPRWDNISKIVLKGGEFTTSINDFILTQQNDVTINNNTNIESTLIQCQKNTHNFSINNKSPWTKYTIPNSLKIINNINTGLPFDMKLKSKYYAVGDNEWQDITVLRNVPDEDDLINGNIVFTEVENDKNISLRFGNGQFGNLGYGNYELEYYETEGASANNKIQIGSKLNLSIDGVYIYDNNGNVIPNPNFISDLIEIISISPLTDGEDIDSKEDIRNKAMKSNAINNLLMNSSDYKFYINNYYSVSDTQFWGDNVENRIRYMNKKENFNSVYFTSKSLKYDFDLNRNIRYNFRTNQLSISDSVYDYNPLSFDVIPDCERYSHKKLDDCLSFKTLYILGKVKPILFYYSLLNEDSSIIYNMINSLESKSNDLNFAYIEADKIQLTVNVYVNGYSDDSDEYLINKIRTDYNEQENKFNIDNSIRNTLLDTNYNVNNITISPMINLTRYNVDLNSIMINNGVSNFDRIIINNILDYKKLSYVNNSYNKVSEYIRATHYFVEQISPYLNTPSKSVIKSLLIYITNKYNETKYNATNNNNLENLDIPLIQFNLSNIQINKN